MPLYRFEFHDEGQPAPDTRSLSFPSDHAAWHHGVDECGRMLREQAGGEEPNGGTSRIECLSEGERGVFSITFRAVRLMRKSSV